MKTRQILIAAATTLVAVAPAFAAPGSYTEASMWGDLAADVASYSGKSFVAPAGKVLATETGIYEQLAAEHRMRSQEPTEGGAGPTGPTMAEAPSHPPTYELRRSEERRVGKECRS